MGWNRLSELKRCPEGIQESRGGFFYPLRSNPRNLVTQLNSSKPGLIHGLGLISIVIPMAASAQSTWSGTTSVNWNWEKWNATLLMYQKSGGRVNNWGGCNPLSDGYDTMTPVDDKTCVDNEPGSITFGQTSTRVYDRRPPRRYFNGSVGYQINEAWKINLYASNIFDKIYGDKWCGDFAFCIDDPVGREVSGEIIFKF